MMFCIKCFKFFIKYLFWNLVLLFNCGCVLFCLLLSNFCVCSKEFGRGGIVVLEVGIGLLSKLVGLIWLIFGVGFNGFFWFDLC